MIDDTAPAPAPASSSPRVGDEETPGCVAAVAAVTGAACGQPSDGGGEGAGGAGSGWLRGLWSTARSQSATVMDFMRRDINEFVSVVRTDTKDAVQRTAGAVRDSVNKDTATVASSRLRSGLNRFLDSVSSAMTIPPDDSEEEALVYGEGGWHPAKSRREGRILSLQMDAKTFETAPEDDQYPSWRETFDVDAKKTEISELLVSNSEVRAAYTRLVPHTILHREFWARYYFRLQSVENEEARWEALKERAGRKEATVNDWGDDWDEEAPPAAANQASDSAAAPPAPAPAPAEVSAPRKEEAAREAREAGEPKTRAEAAPELAPEPEPEHEPEGDQFRVMERSDVVVVKHKDSPESSSESCGGSAGVPEATVDGAERKLSADVDDAKDLDDWEAELDVEVTAEEIEEAKRTARELKDANQLEDDEDWENWE